MSPGSDSGQKKKKNHPIMSPIFLGKSLERLLCSKGDMIQNRLRRTFFYIAEYQTSFEDKELNGWNNQGWRFNQGSTSTQDTGPNAAFDGEFTQSRKLICFAITFSNSYRLGSLQLLAI